MEIAPARTPKSHRPGPHRPRRLLSVVATAVVGMIALSACLTDGQTQDQSLVNKERSANRLGSLGTHNAAMSKAQAWSDHMASTGVLEHTGGGSRVDTKPLTGWCSYGENVGMGPSVDAVHRAFLASAPHKANMLGKYTVIGTGVTTKGNKVWVTEIYLKTC